MRIVTNPGSNLEAALVERYGLDLTPQQIVVDGVAHDTRESLSLGQVDDWVTTAKEHPYVLGTSAAEFARLFRELGAGDPEILAVMTSRKLIQSHDAAVSAARTVAAFSKQPVRVRVVDTGFTDVGTGLVTLMAALGRDHGMPLEALAAMLERFAGGAKMVLHVATMHNLIKGGRASFLKGWLANLMQLRPVLTLTDGEIEVAEKLSTRADPVEALARIVGTRFAGRRVWVGVTHGNAPDQGARLASALRAALDAALIYVRPLSPSVYLHAGPGAVGCFVLPIDQLGWDPPSPELG